MRGNDKGRFFFLPQIARISTNYFWIEGLKDLGIEGLGDGRMERLKDFFSRKDAKAQRFFTI